MAASNKKRTNGAFVEESPTYNASSRERMLAPLWSQNQYTYSSPVELEAKLAEFLGFCLYGRPVTDALGEPILDQETNEQIRIHDNMTVPTMTSAAWHCGFRSRQSLYEYEKRGDEWAAVVQAFREASENWLVTRGIRSKPGDNPIFMSMVLQSRYGYARSDAAKDEEQPDDPKQIASTPEDVQRVIASMDLGDDEKDG